MVTVRKNAVVIVSIGERPWIDSVLELAQAYAERCAADLIVETEHPSLEDFPFPELPDSPGRPHKRVYACKSYFAYKHLVDSGYQRVLVIDDSCCISPNCPDLFAVSEPNSVVYVKTGEAHAEKSFAHIRKFLRLKKLPMIEFEPEHYMNSGVLLYDRDMAEAISPRLLADCADLTYSVLPHQTLTYYLLAKAGVKMKQVDAKFNHVPGAGLDKELRRDMTDIRPYLRNGIHIHHVTGMYRRRDLLIEQVCTHLKGEARTA